MGTATDAELNIRPGQIQLGFSPDAVAFSVLTLSEDGMDRVSVKQDRERVRRIVRVLQEWLDEPTVRHP
jgi:hypothetical protein